VLGSRTKADVSIPAASTNFWPLSSRLSARAPFLLGTNLGPSRSGRTQTTMHACDLNLRPRNTRSGQAGFSSGKSARIRFLASSKSC
jgi:hypothetical protein